LPGLALPCVDSDGACLQSRISEVRWLDHQKSDIIERQTSWAIELSTSGDVHVADPHDEVELQFLVNVVHLKALEFGVVKPVRN
jgi:hypothetical protein